MLDSIHGGDIYSYDKGIIDFSANVNPLGLPKSVKEAAIKSIDQCSPYPDPKCRELIKAISEHDNISADNIICGNGAADLIYRVVYAKKPKKALILAPTFAEYEVALKSLDCQITYHYLNTEDFSLNEDILDKIELVDILFICNPNNPTGVLTKKSLLIKIMIKCEQNNTLLVIDECFNDFIDNPEEYTLKNYIGDCKNLVILKAFTKIYAMAGIRLGYAYVSDPLLLTGMYNSGSTWNVSTIAQASGVFALKETDYLKETRLLIFEQRAYLKEEFIKLGLTLFDSQGNYIFFKSQHESLKEELISHNVLIRDCSNYHGLSKGYYRIGIKLPEQNTYLTQCLKNCLGG